MRCARQQAGVIEKKKGSTMNDKKIKELMQGKDYENWETFKYWCKLKKYKAIKIINADTLSEYSKEYLEGIK